MAGATGLEPAASGVTGRRSNQLNYAPAQGTVEGYQKGLSFSNAGLAVLGEGISGYARVAPVSGGSSPTRRRCTALSAIPDITLNDGNTIPQLGFGVFQIEPMRLQGG